MDELLTRWQRGWSLSRGWTSYTETDHVITVHIGEPDRQIELFSTDEYADRAAQLILAAPYPPGAARLAVITTDPDRVGQSLRPLKVRHTLWLMTIFLADQPQHPIPPPYELHLITRAGVVHAELRRDGESAATGRIAVHGTDAVVDMITTEPAHRRRGLASALMTVLVAQARAQGATIGLLLASSEGNLLYNSLHWIQRHQLVLATT